jgi:2-polyprenyl-3-methyl-5-hydroxy-6-metoxy-1,4-benzoquinol methylase
VKIDFSKTAADYLAHRVAFAPELFDRLRRFDIGTRGQKLLDLGAGTGLLACAFAEAGCSVTRSI